MTLAARTPRPGSSTQPEAAAVAGAADSERTPTESTPGPARRHCAQRSLPTCASWTSLHAGYGQALTSDRSLGGLEVRRAAGSGLHAPYALIGARLDAGDHQFDAEGHVGVMRPLRLAKAFTLVPSLTVELARVSYVAGRWDGGALGPGLDRSGIGLRVAAERDIRFGGTGHPGLGDTILWFTLGASHATGSEPEECARVLGPLWPFGPEHFLQPLPAATPAR